MNVLKGVLAVLGLFVLIGVIWVVAYGISWAVAGPNGKLQARQQILSGDSRIVAYNHFYDLCASAQTDQTRLSAQRDELKSASADDKDRVQANIAGIKSDLADAVNQYNVDAAKSYTIGQFRSLGLPYTISQEALISCVA